MSLIRDMKSVTGLAGDAVEQLGVLIQAEVRLAKAEMADKATQVGIGASYLVGAAVLIIPVMVLLLIALALWLTTMGLSAPIAHLAAAMAGAVAAAVLALVGSRYLKAIEMRPEVTMRQVDKDVAMLKEATK